jgi:hypothetical protein
VIARQRAVSAARWRGWWPARGASLQAGEVSVDGGVVSHWVP